MKIFSWNINGIRAIEKKGFLDIIAKENPDIFCLQETKAFLDQLPPSIKNLPYHIVWHDGVRPGYAGTAIFSKTNRIPQKQTLKNIQNFTKTDVLPKPSLEMLLFSIYISPTVVNEQTVRKC